MDDLTTNGAGPHEPEVPETPENGAPAPAPVPAGPVPTYAEAFPALPLRPGGTSQARPVRVATAVRPSATTEIFYIALDEQKFRESAAMEKNPEPRICASIGETFGVDVECSRSRDRQLTVVVTGKRDKVFAAKTELMKKLQSPTMEYVGIPTDHHRFIIGTGGQALQAMQTRFGVNIRVPKSSDEDRRIQVEGPKESVRACAQHIFTISDEKAKKDIQRLAILKAYHQLLSGFGNKNINKLYQLYPGIRINIPPAAVAKDEIVITGDKDNVARAAAHLLQLYDQQKATCGEHSGDIPKSQHRFIIGPKGAHLKEIEETTGVVVELPRPETASNKVTIRGPLDNLPFAWKMVCEKANSIVVKEVEVPNWLHRHLIGRGGENVRKLRTSDQINIKFHNTNMVEVEGPPAEVAVIEQQLLTQSADLQARMTYADVKVEAKHRSHIIGKDGSVIGKIKAETGCQITMPRPDAEDPNVRIEGPPDAVLIAKAQIEALVEKQKNYKNIDVIVPYKLHNQIIGTGGSNIRKLNEEFPDVSINVPSAKQKSDIIQLRGDRQQVDGLEVKLKKLHKQLEAESHEIEVPVIKQYHRNIIGRGGAVISNIKETSGAKIDVPNERSQSNTITVTGTVEACEKAREMILKIQDEISSIVEEKLDIDSKFHGMIIGPKGSGINAIMNDHNVILRFPSAKSKTASNKVTIKGNQEDVNKAKERIQDIISGGGAHVEEFSVKRTYHRILNGRGGSGTAKILKETGARVFFPTTKDTENDVVTVMGTEEACKTAKTQILARVEELENSVDKDFKIADYKYIREMKQSRFMRELQEDLGSVSVTLPKAADKEEGAELVVRLKGPAGDVQQVIERMEGLIKRVDDTTSIKVTLPRSAIPAIMGFQGKNVRQLTEAHSVDINVPKRRKDAPAEETITISGLAADCEAAKEAMMALVPQEEIMLIPAHFHRFMIGAKGESVRQLMDEFEVQIRFPKSDADSDKVKIRGLPSDVEGCRKALESRMEELKDEMAQNFKAEAKCDSKLFPLWLADRKAEIEYVVGEYDVRVDLPRRDAKKQDVLLVTGFQDAVGDAIKFIEGRNAEFTQMYVWKTVNIRSDAHPRIIGPKGSKLREIQEDFNVVLQMPPKSQTTITIIGSEEDAAACIDELKGMEGPGGAAAAPVVAAPAPVPKKKSKGKSNGAPTGPLFRDAPWDAPNTTDTALFPSLGGGKAPASAAGGVWGRK